MMGTSLNYKSETAFAWEIGGPRVQSKDIQHARQFLPCTDRASPLLGVLEQSALLPLVNEIAVAHREPHDCTIG
jgi:hypothetical protein